MKSGKEGMMNRAQENIHKSGGDTRTKAGSGSVGQERKAEVRQAQGSNPGDQGNPLRGAKHELMTQHPIAHDDLGPHHGGTHHIRHEPMGGMRGK